MRLSNLIASNNAATLHGTDVDVNGITADSRHVEKGCLFIAIPGTKNDGRVFIDEAIARGAAAILAPTGTPIPASVSHIYVSDVRAATSTVAATFYARQPDTIVAVTGTSGKTSTAQFTRELWSALGKKSASIGTLGYISADEAQYGSLTTPDAINLHRLLDESVGKGITHMVMEASSHGLALNRLDHVRVKAGGFTNLSRDHLDYHETMESYLAAKLRLFTEIIAPGGTAVLNADIPEFETLAQAANGHSLKVISYGKKSREIRLLSATPHAHGQILKVDLFNKVQEVLLPTIGAFQAWNGLCATGLAIATGTEPAKALEALGRVSGVPGRLQLAGVSPAGGAVFVDYAHKPDALENVLAALLPHVAAHTGAKLGVIFGCGGNRDKGKRPIMGGIAQRLADWVIVTDDNPRHEEPATIRREILAGCTPAATLREVGDRERAIAEGIAQLGAHDVLVIAGKGHESGQIVGDVVTPFDDAEIARKFLAK